MIAIYGSSNCIWCLRAKQLCEVFELSHTYHLIDDIGVDKFQELFPDENTVPQILWDDEVVGGYQEFAVKVNDYITNENEEIEND